MQNMVMSQKYLVFNSGNGQRVPCTLLSDAKKEAAYMGEELIKGGYPSATVSIAELILDCDVSVKYVPKFETWR